MAYYTVCHSGKVLLQYRPTAVGNFVILLHLLSQQWLCKYAGDCYIMLVASEWQ